jgi:phage-related baseplate assembly protein
MATFAELLTVPTTDTIKAALFAELQSRGFTITNWTTGGPERTLVESIAEIIADYAGPLATNLASWALLFESSGLALESLTKENYETTRQAATFAIWTMTIINDTGSPIAITAGQVWLQDINGLRFNNTTAHTIGGLGSASVTFKAESPGSAYNANAPASFVTPVPGLSIDDSVLASSAVDAETDAALALRASQIWATLGAGSVKAAYERHAKDASANVKRVLVQENLPSAGQVKVTIAREDSTSLVGDNTTVQTYLNADARRPFCTSSTVVSATETTIAVTATVKILAEKQAAAAAAVNTKLLEFLRTFGISDGSLVVSKEKLEGVLLALDGVIDITPSLPAADVALVSGAIAKLGTVTITWDTV